MEKAISLVKSKVFWGMLGGAAVAVGGYFYVTSRNSTKSGRESISSEEKVRIFIEKELKRLKDPKLVLCDGPFGEVEVLKKDDFFDILLAI